MADTKTILIADDETNVRRVLRGILERDGHAVETAANGHEALATLSQREVHAVVTDLRMPRMDGMSLLRHVTADYPDIPVVILTAHGSVDNAVAAVKLGAFDYLEKPFDQEQIREVVQKAMRTNELRRREVSITGPAHGKGRFGLIGTSPAMQAVYNVIEKVAPTRSTVLITGESGTGKELIAQAIHDHSPRKTEPLIKVNCAAIPGTLIESELFGYEKGAFTGANSSKRGRFELAENGTLFLDEIGDIPPEMQVKLLRALQENEFERVGGIKTVKVDVRLIAATNADLVAQIAAKRFREDLYYRLNVVPIDLPPLRARKTDLPDLVAHILERFRARLGKTFDRVHPEALACLAAYGWPGNIRELENLLERTVLFSDGDEIKMADLPEPVSSGEPNESARPHEASLKEIVRAETDKLEKTLILSALGETGGNVTHAAKRLGISRKSVQNKMKELGLRDADAEHKATTPSNQHKSNGVDG